MWPFRYNKVVKSNFSIMQRFNNDILNRFNSFCYKKNCILPTILKLIVIY